MKWKQILFLPVIAIELLSCKAHDPEKTSELSRINTKLIEELIGLKWSYQKLLIEDESIKAIHTIDSSYTHNFSEATKTKLAYEDGRLTSRKWNYEEGTMQKDSAIYSNNGMEQALQLEYFGNNEGFSRTFHYDSGELIMVETRLRNTITGRTFIELQNLGNETRAKIYSYASYKDQFTSQEVKSHLFKSNDQQIEAILLRSINDRKWLTFREAEIAFKNGNLISHHTLHLVAAEERLGKIQIDRLDKHNLSMASQTFGTIQMEYGYNEKGDVVPKPSGDSTRFQYKYDRQGAWTDLEMITYNTHLGIADVRTIKRKIFR